MRFSGTHQNMIWIRLRDPDLTVFVVETDSQQSDHPALSGFSHRFLSIPYLHSPPFSGLFSVLLPDGVMVAQQTLNLLV